MKKIIDKEKTLRKAINDLTRTTLNAYKKGHKMYSRNMRWMFNSLVDNNIIEGLDKAGLIKFKKIWPKLKKELRMGLIVTSFYDSTKFTSFYTNNGKSITNLAVVGNTILEKGLSPLADEQQSYKYRENILTAKYEIWRKKTLQEMKEYLRAVKEDEKDVSLFRRELEKATKQMHKLAQDEAFSNVNNWKELLHNLDVENEALYMEDRIEQNEKNFNDIQKALSENIEEIKLRLKEKKTYIKTYETIKEESDLLVKEAVGHTLDSLEAFKKQIELMQDAIQNKQTKTDNELEKVPFVQKEMKALIGLDKQLQTFKETVDQLRMDFREAWDIMTYGSGGPDRRTAISGVIDPSTGDTMEGFWMRNLKVISKELLIFKEIFTKTRDRLPESTVSNELMELADITDKLASTLYDQPKFFERQIAPHGTFRDEKGHILNIDEHPLVQQMLANIQDGFKTLLIKADKTLEASQNFQAINEQEIIKAKREKLTARQYLNKLNRENKSIDKLIAKYKTKNIDE